MASKPLSQVFGTSASLETEGIVINYGEYGSFKCARAGGKNKAFRNLMERKLRPYRSAINMGTMDESILEKLTHECFAEAVVLGWDIVEQNELGEIVPVPFTREKCVELFQQYPDLFTDLLQQTQTVINFVEESRADDAKS